MKYSDKLSKAHAELEACGIWKSNYNPPLFDIARRLGYKTAPPHYRSFLSNFFRQTLFFFILWGSTMWFFIWRDTMISIEMMLAISSSVSLFLGFLMASYYHFSHKYHQLTRWQDFK